MGLFDFVKDAGEKIFHTEAKAAEARTEMAQRLGSHVTAMGFEVEGLAVDFNDKDVATLRGTVASQKEMEQVVLTVGNVSGVASVDNQLVVKKPEPEAVFYTVKSGDTLGAIAKAHLGSAGAYMKIFEANTPMLKDPNKIYPGQTLRIPKS